MHDGTNWKAGSPFHLVRMLCLTLFLPRGNRGILGGVARTVLYLVVAILLVFLVFWGVIDATSR